MNETVIDTEIPATRKSESVSEDTSARRNSWHEPTINENTQKIDDEELQDDELQGVPDWLQEFKGGFVDESVPEHRESSSSSHALPSEQRTKVAPNKHNYSCLCMWTVKKTGWNETEHRPNVENTHERH